MLIKHLVMKNIIWSNNRVQSIMQMCMSGCTTANFSSCWFYFCGIFFLNLFCLFYFQYYQPLVFWPPYQLNFQNAPEVIFSSLACHSRLSICSSQSLFSLIFQYAFHLSYLSHTKVGPLLIAVCWNPLIFQGLEHLSSFPYFFFLNIFSISYLFFL